MQINNPEEIIFSSRGAVSSCVLCIEVMEPMILTVLSVVFFQLSCGCELNSPRNESIFPNKATQTGNYGTFLPLSKVNNQRCDHWLL